MTRPVFPPKKNKKNTDPMEFTHWWVVWGLPLCWCYQWLAMFWNKMEPFKNCRGKIQTENKPATLRPIIGEFSPLSDLQNNTGKGASTSSSVGGNQISSASSAFSYGERERWFPHAWSSTNQSKANNKAKKTFKNLPSDGPKVCNLCTCVKIVWKKTWVPREGTSADALLTPTFLESKKQSSLSPTSKDTGRFNFQAQNYNWVAW